MAHHRTMRAAIIVVTGIAVAAWGVVAASSLAEVSVDVAAAEATASTSASMSTSPSTSASTSPPPSEPGPAEPSSPSTAAGTAAATTVDPTPVVPSALPSGPAPVGAFVLGDSISLSIAPALSRLGYPVTGKVGQSASTAYLAEHLSTEAAQSAPAWVIVLGTNNPGDDQDVERMREWIRTIREKRTKGARQDVFWVTPHRPEAYVGGLSDSTLDDFNARLMDFAATREWLTVLDFAGTAASNDQWFEQDGQHLHPDADGQAHLIELIAGPDPRPADSPAPVTTIAPPEPSPSAPPSDDDAAYYSEFEFSND